MNHFISGVKKSNGEFDALVSHYDFGLVDQHFENHVTGAQVVEVLLRVVDGFVLLAVKQVPLLNRFVGAGLVRVFDDAAQQDQQRNHDVFRQHFVPRNQNLGNLFEDLVGVFVVP